MTVMRLSANLLASVVALLLPAASPDQPATSFVIVGAQVADGTGASLSKADVRVVGDSIAEVGTLSPKPGEKVVRGDGLVLSPGFIDVHNHSTRGLVTDPDAETQTSQGITTAVQGPDGDSPWPIGAWLAEREKSPAAINVMTMV